MRTGAVELEKKAKELFHARPREEGKDDVSWDELTVVAQEAWRMRAAGVDDLSIAVPPEFVTVVDRAFVGCREEHEQIFEDLLMTALKAQIAKVRYENVLERMANFTAAE